MKRNNSICKRLFVLVLTVAVCMTLFENFSRVSAASTYQIKINKQQNCVTIYKLGNNGKYKPVKAMACSTGYATPVGTFPLGEKMRWHTLMGPCYGQYCTRIHGGILFHSVWYYKKTPSSLSSSAYNKLGVTASHGCGIQRISGVVAIHGIRKSQVFPVPRVRRCRIMVHIPQRKGLQQKIPQGTM